MTSLQDRCEQLIAHVLASDLDRHAQVAVVADDDGGVDVPLEDVDEQVCGDVDVGALPLASGD
jgi:hypothetical protein